MVRRSWDTDRVPALPSRWRTSIRWKDASRNGIVSIACECRSTTIPWIHGASEASREWYQTKYRTRANKLELGCVRRGAEEPRQTRPQDVHLKHGQCRRSVPALFWGIFGGCTAVAAFCRNIIRNLEDSVASLLMILGFRVMTSKVTARSLPFPFGNAKGDVFCPLGYG
jgi:hypothetical protein